MSAGRSQFRLRTLLLLCVCIVLTALLVHLLRAPLHPMERATGATRLPAAEPPEHAFQPFNMPAKEEFVVIWERPLFRQSRRPAEIKAAVAVPAKAKKPTTSRPKPIPQLRQLALVGIALIGDRRLALLRPNGERGVLQVVEGEALDGWQVESIETEAVTFRFGTNRRRVEFPKPAVRPGSTAAPPRLRRQ